MTEVESNVIIPEENGKLIEIERHEYVARMSKTNNLN
jgi:hypothetical protein